MSGVYKLINLFLFLAFSGLLALLTHTITRVEPTILLPEASNAGKPGAEAPSAAGGRPRRSPQVQPSFGSYSDVVDQNLFAEDRKPWDESAQAAPQPEPTPGDAEAEPVMELPVGLQLTGVVLIGATKLAFFDESSVQSMAAGPRGVPQPGMAQGSEGASRLQQRLLQQQRLQQAGKIQEAVRGSGPTAGMPGMPGMDGAEGAAEAKPKPPKHGYREGDEIQGLKLEEIRRTEVILSKDGIRAALPLTQAPRLLPGGPQGAQAPGQPPGVVPPQQIQAQQKRAQEQQRRLAERQRRLAEQQRRKARRLPPNAVQPREAVLPEDQVIPEDEGDPFEDEGMSDEEEYLDEEVDPMGSPMKRAAED